jgi:transcriptional regulator with XRE-family HTH domain
MKGQFNEKIPAHREQQHLSLRQVAALLERDKARLSKIEKGLRHLKREKIPTVAPILKAGCDELMTLWLADQIYGVLKEGKLAIEAMQVAEKNVNLNKKKNN